MTVFSRQRTIRAPVRCAGKALHSGVFSRLVVHPAMSGGIVFRRPDGNIIPARWDYVVASDLCTTLRNDSGAQVATIEHLMSALAGCRIDHAVVEVDGEELPVMDGSAAPYVDMITSVGVVDLPDDRRVIRLLKPFSFKDGDRTICAMPDPNFSVSCDICFDYLGAQKYHFTQDFNKEIAPARTFCRADDVEAMRARGLARGGSLDNALVFSDQGLITPGGLRFGNECVRHKILDMIGDLFLAGAPLRAAIKTRRPGHALTCSFVRALMLDKKLWCYEKDIDADIRTHPSDHHVQPARDAVPV